MSCHSENEDDVPLQNLRIKLTRKLKQKDKKIRFKKEFCCVCLNNVFKLTKVIKQPKYEDTNYFTMLETIVPEIEWCSSYHICTTCSCSLIDAHSFRLTCVNSSFLTKKPSILGDKEEDGFQQKKKDQYDDKPGKLNHNVNADMLLSKTEDTNDKQISSHDFDINNKEFYDVKEELNDFTHDNDSDSDKNRSSTKEIHEEEIPEKKETKKRKVKKKSNEKTVLIQKTTYKKRIKNVFSCEKCKFITTRSNQLINHYIEVHELKSDDVKPFKCHSCQKTFHKFYSLSAHAKTHEDDRPFVCSYCGKSFKRDADLQVHEKRHLNTREYKCELCGKGYNTYKDLGSHKVAVHTDPTKWKWVCEVCSKPFPIKSNYESHMRRHKGDKKFVCYLCPKRFTDKIVLQKHLRVHSNVRNYKCSECQKEYKEENSLLVHMARIHSIGVDKVKIPQKVRNRYICHICPKAFGGKDKLTRHLYQHSGEKPFGCSVCDKKYIDKSYVKQHMRRTHGLSDSEKCDVDEMGVLFSCKKVI